MGAKTRRGPPGSGHLFTRRDLVENDVPEHDAVMLASELQRWVLEGGVHPMNPEEGS